MKTAATRAARVVLAVVVRNRAVATTGVVLAASAVLVVAVTATVVAVRLVAMQHRAQAVVTLHPVVSVVGTMLVAALVLLAAATRTRLNRAVASVRLNLPVQAVVVMVSSAMPQVAKTAAMARPLVVTVARVLVASRRLVAVRALKVAVASRVKVEYVPGAGCTG